MRGRASSKGRPQSGSAKRPRKRQGMGVFKFLILIAGLAFVSLKVAEGVLSPDSVIRSAVTDHMEDAISLAEKWFRSKIGLPEAGDAIQRQNEDLSQMTPIKPSYVLRPPDAIEFNDE